MTAFALLISTLFVTLAGPAAHAEDRAVSESAVRVLAGANADTLPGTIRPDREVTVSSPFDTLLGRLLVEEGQTVSAGDVVAVLDDRVVQASVRLAEQEAARSAQIDRAEAAVVHTADVLRRIRVVRNLNAAAESELVAAEAEHKKALADLLYAREARAEARASLQLARARLEEHSVRAPFDAVVVRVHTEPGAMLAAGKPIADLMSVDGLCVDLYLPAPIAAHLAIGERYALSVQVPAPAVVAGAVRYVEPRIDPVSRTMRVVFDLDVSPDGPRLFAGALARPALTSPASEESQGRPLAAEGGEPGL